MSENPTPQEADSLIGVLAVDDFLNRFTLVVGDVNSGKTRLTRYILRLFVESGRTDRLAVVDLAPDMNEADIPRGKRVSEIGGRLLAPPASSVAVFHGRIHPPRLRARSSEEAMDMAQQNAKTAHQLFKRALARKPEAIFVNDASLYLHAANPQTFLNWVRSVPTAVVNAYWGTTLGEGPLTERERRSMAFLMEKCDRLIHLPISERAAEPTALADEP